MSLAVTFSSPSRRSGATRCAPRLTALGIIIGVAAVIVMVAIGAGAQQSIEAQIRSAGSNIVIVSAGSGSTGPVRLGQGNVTTLTPADAEAIRAEVPGIRCHLSRRQPAHAGRGARRPTGARRCRAPAPSCRRCDRGRSSWAAYFTEQDVVRAARVVVLGAVVRDQLFGAGTDPTGATLRIRNQPFRVLGVLSRKGQAAMGQDQDDTVIVPYTTVQKRLLGHHAHPEHHDLGRGRRLPGRGDGRDRPPSCARRHRIAEGEENDFTVRTLEEMASVLTSTTDDHDAGCWPASPPCRCWSAASAS